MQVKEGRKSRWSALARGRGFHFQSPLPEKLKATAGRAFLQTADMHHALVDV
jgi:hypothetical protein